MSGRPPPSPAPDPQPPANQDFPSPSEVQAPAAGADAPARESATQAGVEDGHATGALGQPAAPGAGLVAVGLLIGMVMVLGLVVLALRKRLFRAEPPDAGSGLLDDLRRSLREGRITQEEFDAARRVLVARLKGDLTPEKNPKRRG